MNAFVLRRLLLVMALLPSLALADAESGKTKAAVCVICHDLAREDKVLVPVLEGQPREFFIAQIAAFRAKQRSSYNMDIMVIALSTTDIADLADYFATQKAARPPLYVDEKLAAAGDAKLRELHCSTCHLQSYSGQGAVPRLAGQKPRYTAWTLHMIGLGNRVHPAEAAPEMKALSNDDIERIAHAFASM